VRLPQPPAFAVPLGIPPAAASASGGGLQGVATSRSISGESTGSTGSGRIAPAAASTAASASRISVRTDGAVSASAAAAAAAAMEAGLSARTFRAAPPLAAASAAGPDLSAGPASTGPIRRSSGHVRQLSGTPPPPQQQHLAAAGTSSSSPAAAAVRSGGDGASLAPRAPPPAPPRRGLPCGSSPTPSASPSPSPSTGTGAGHDRAGEMATPTEASQASGAGGVSRRAAALGPAAAASGASSVPPLSPGLSTAPSLASSCRTDSAESGGSGGSVAGSVASGSAGASAPSKRSPRLSEHRNAQLSALLPPPRGPRPSAGTVTPGGIAALASDGEAGSAAAAASASPRSACAVSGVATRDTDAAAAAAVAGTEAPSSSEPQARSLRNAVDSAGSCTGTSGDSSGGKVRGVRMSVLQPGRSHELGAEQLHELLDWAGFDEDEEEGEATDGSDSDEEPGKPSLRRVAHRSHTGADRVASPAQPRSAGAGDLAPASPSASHTHSHSHSSAASTASSGASPRSIATRSALPTAAGATPPALPQPHRSRHSGVGASSPAITIGASCPEAVHARHLLRVPSAGSGTDTSLAHSGWLMKRGQGAFAGWKRRWFVLQAAVGAAGGVGSPPGGVLAGAGAVPEPTPLAAAGATADDGAGGQPARTALLYYYEQPTDSEPRGVIPLTAASIARTVAGAARPGVSASVAADGADPGMAAIPARSPALGTSASGSRSSIPGGSAGAGAADRCFAIQRQGRTHLLQASTAEEAATWLSAIASVVA
jgi:hypothetical protein